jgi:hypothetical protein
MASHSPSSIAETGLERAMRHTVTYRPRARAERERWLRIDAAFRRLRHRHDVYVDVWWSAAQAGYAQCERAGVYSVVVPIPDRPEHELVAYHEVGHVARAHFEPSAPRRSHFDIEIEAWDYAFATFKRAAPTEARRYAARLESFMASALCSYLLAELRAGRPLPRSSHPVWGQIARSGRVHPSMRRALLADARELTGARLPYDASLPRLLAAMRSENSARRERQARRRGKQRRAVLRA